jgi:hypothetical protein
MTFLHQSANTHRLRAWSEYISGVRWEAFCHCGHGICYYCLHRHEVSSLSKLPDRTVCGRRSQEPKLRVRQPEMDLLSESRTRMMTFAPSIRLPPPTVIKQSACFSRMSLMIGTRSSQGVCGRIPTHVARWLDPRASSRLRTRDVCFDRLVDATT